MIFQITRHELHRLYHSPMSWGLMALVQFLLAIFFFVILSQYLQLQDKQNSLGISNTVVAGTLQTGGFLMIMILPLLSTRFFCEEQRNHSLSLLFSSPVSLTQLVVGKYLGILIYLYILLTIVSLMPFSLMLGTNLDVGLFLSGYLGLIMLASCITAIGLFVSTCTSQPIVAAAGTYAISFFLWIINMADASANPVVNSFISYISMLNHFNNLVAGIVSTIDVAYFFLLSIGFISLSIWRLDVMRTSG